MKKMMALILSVLMLMMSLAACGGAPAAAPATEAPTTAAPVAAETTAAATEAADSDMADIIAKGVIVVGITDYAPMDYLDENGEWTGFDAEFARMFAAELGVDVEFFVLTDWGMKFQELDAGNIDVVWNGMTITEEVQLSSNCSNPYVINAQVVVMKADKVGSYTTTDSLKELNFAVENGSAGQKALDDLGITSYVVVQDQGRALMEVAAGTSDACVIDITMANAMTGEGTDYPDLAAGISLTSEEYGVAFRKGSDMTAYFNEVMAKWMADGTLDALAKKYNLTLVK